MGGGGDLGDGEWTRGEDVFDTMEICETVRLVRQGEEGRQGEEMGEVGQGEQGGDVGLVGTSICLRFLGTMSNLDPLGTQLFKIPNK